MAQFIWPLEPVSVSTGDLATEATLATRASEATLAALAAEDFATEATLASLNAKVTAVNTGAVTVSSSALPTGAATEATLAALAAEDFATETTLTALNAKVTAVNTGAVVVSSSALPSGAATEATLSTASTTLTSIENALSLTVVDQIDTTPLLDTSSTNIPASASNPVAVVASTAAITRKIVSVEDVGEFIGLYTGAALSETLLCVLPLGGGEIDVVISAGTRISLRNMKNAAISTGFIALNFLG